MRLRDAAPLVLLLLLLSGCEGVTDPPGPSFVRATVTGEVQKSFEGVGEWGTGTADHGKVWSLHATEGGDPRTDAVGLSRFVGGRPSPGSYPIRLLGYFQDARPGFQGSFLRVLKSGENTHVSERYISESGVARITASTDQRVEGAFEFTAFRICTQGIDDGELIYSSCEIPRTPPADAPRITVTGSFAAARGHNNVD